VAVAAAACTTCPGVCQHCKGDQEQQHCKQASRKRSINISAAHTAVAGSSSKPQALMGITDKAAVQVSCPAVSREASH
jgi:hypothetical protein